MKSEMVKTKMKNEKIAEIYISFWSWFFEDGLKSLFLNRWYLIHLMFGLLVAIALKSPLVDFLSPIGLPLVLLVLTLSVSWLAAMPSIIFSKEFRSHSASNNPMLLRDHINRFQNTILLFLTVVSVGVLLSTKLIEPIRKDFPYCVRLLGTGFYLSLMCLSVREFWQIVNAFNRILLLNSVQAVVDEAKEVE